MNRIYSVVLAAAAACICVGSSSASASPIPVRDTILRDRDATASAFDSIPTQRYAVHDGAGRTVEIGVSVACQVTCTDANPTDISNFLGTLPHGSEISTLEVQMLTPAELTDSCGANALACYSSNRTMIISGDDAVNDPPYNPSREYVVAHEYGHHIERSRSNPTPLNPALSWGIIHWMSEEQVCRGQRQGDLFPGSEGDTGYWKNPGEAFAEAYAEMVFPTDGVRWLWTSYLEPDAAAFAAIQEDVYSPWKQRSTSVARVSLSRQTSRSKSISFQTHLDGDVSITARGKPGTRIRLLLRDSSGSLVRSSSGRDNRQAMSFPICGQRKLRTVVRRIGRRGGPVRLAISRP